MRCVRHPFSLVEMMVVIAIILVISTLAAGRLGFFPVAANLEKTERELELLFTQSAHLAAVRGRPIAVAFHPETNAFELEMEESDNSDANVEYLKNRYKSVALPSDMSVEFPKQPATPETEVIRFYCYPDATASGPEMLLKYHTRRLRLRLSPLTGQLLRQDNRKDKR